MTAALSDPFGLLGQVLDGQFRIDEVAGEGGSSVVYRGEHVGFDSKVAIKCLKVQTYLESALADSFMRRFRDEGRSSYKLSQGHFHIVRCIAIGTTTTPPQDPGQDAGKDPGQDHGRAPAPKAGSLIPYMVLEWLDGQSFARELEERRLAGAQGRPIADLLEHLDTAIDAVAYAHTQGVAHRDLHPGSIFLARTREGDQAKVLDFGLAKIVREHAIESAGQSATAGAFRVFSPAYAAPEQLDETLGPIGPWTDVYTLAMVLLEAMRDQPPFLGLSLPELRTKILDASSRPTPRDLGVVVSDDVQAVFARALAREPSARIQDAGAFWSALKAAAETGMPTPDLEADATQRMDAIPDSDALLQAGSYDDGPTLNDQVSIDAIRKAIDDETTIDERLEAMLPTRREYHGLVESVAPAPEVSGVHASAPVDAMVPSPDLTGPRPRTPSADFTGPHHAMSPDATAPRQGLSADGWNAWGPQPRQKPARGPVVLAVLLGGGAAVILLAVFAALYLQGVQRTESTRAASSAQPPVPAAPRAPEAVPEAVQQGAPEAVQQGAPEGASASPGASGSHAVAPAGSGGHTHGSSHAPSKGGPVQRPTAPSLDEPTEVPPTEANAFNAGAAQTSLRVLDGILASCKRPDGKAGDGSARVTFANDGSVSAVKVTGPLADAPEGDCVALRYRNAKVPPFEGAPGVVEHAFRLPK